MRNDLHYGSSVERYKPGKWMEWRPETYRGFFYCNQSIIDMTHNYEQGNNHKVAGTQEIYKRAAEICSKYGIEFEDTMLKRHDGNKWDKRIRWSFMPYRIRITAPGKKTDYNPTVGVGIVVYENDQNYWYPINANVEDFDEDDIAVFTEIANILP